MWKKQSNTARLFLYREHIKESRIHGGKWVITEERMHGADKRFESSISSIDPLQPGITWIAKRGADSGNEIQSLHLVADNQG